MFDFLNKASSTKRVKTKDTMTSNKFQCLVDPSCDSSIYRQGQGPSPAINAAVSDLEMETEHNPSNDHLTLLKRYVIEQGSEIMNLKHKVNYLLKFIGMEQDVDDVDVDVDGNRTCLSVPAVEKWSERLIKGKHKNKTLTPNISSAVVNRTKVTIMGAGAGAGAGLVQMLVLVLVLISSLSASLIHSRIKYY